ncbi:MAG: hypothetical protein ACYC63_18935 [Armatimonadota bacterium]
MSSQRPVRSLPSRLAIGVAWFLAALFLLGIAVWLYAVFTLGSRLDHRLGALRQRGEPTTMAEAAPKPVPAARNAAIGYQSVLKVDFAPGAISKREMAGLTDAELNQLSDFRSNPTPEGLEQVRPLLARPSVRHALQTFRRASEKPDCVFPVRWQDGQLALFPHLTKLRNASRLALAQAIVSAADRKPDDAVQWLRVGLRFPRHTLQEPTLIAQLVAYAMYAMVTDTIPAVLAYGDLPQAGTASLQAELATVDLNAPLRQALLTERVFGLNMFDQLAGSMETEGALSWTRRVLINGSARPFWQWQQLHYLDQMDRLIPQTLKPSRETRSTQVSPPARADRFPWDLSSFVLPWFSKIAPNRDQCQARIDMMRLALALNDYHLKHNGSPKTLSQLPLPLPQDPFSGKGFVYRPTDGHYVLYSIGQNLKDDGGKVAGRGEDWMEKGDVVWGM